MKRTVSVILALLLLLSCAAFAEETEIVMTEYADEEYGIALSVPEDWNDLSETTGTLTFASPDAAASVNVVATEAGVVMTSDMLLEGSSEILAQITASYPDYTPVAEAQTYTCGDVEYVMMAGSYTQDDTPLYVITLLTSLDTTNMYVVTIGISSADEALFTQYDAVTEDIAASLRLLDE